MRPEWALLNTVLTGDQVRLLAGAGETILYNAPYIEHANFRQHLCAFSCNAPASRLNFNSIGMLITKHLSS